MPNIFKTPEYIRAILIDGPGGTGHRKFYIEPIQWFPEIDWRCGLAQGTSVHIFWTCPKMGGFWAKVREVIQDMTNYLVPGEPMFFLLHNNNIPLKS